MLLHPVHGFYGVHIGQELTQNPDTVVGVRVVQEVVPAGRGEHQVHGREDALVGQVAVQLEFHVAGTLEFLEDNVVHLGTGFRKGRGQDGERTAVLDVTGSAEEALGLLQGIGVYTAGEHLAGSRLNGIVGAGQAGDGVQQDDDVVAAFHQATGLVQNHVGHFDVALCRFVEGGCNHLCLYGTLHIRHFFRTFVNQENNLVYLRMVVCNGIGDGLQEHGFTRFRLRHNQAALSLADRREHIHNADALVFLVPMTQQVEFFCGEQGSEEVERDAVPDKLRRAAVDEFDFYQREIFISFSGRTDFTGDGVSVLEGVLLDLLLGNVNVVRGIEVIVV